MKEIRIDVTKQTEEELALANDHAQIIFDFNNTIPGTAEYAELIHRIFPAMGENSRVSTPLIAVRPHMVSIGKNVVIMPGCLMMSAGWWDRWFRTLRGIVHPPALSYQDKP